MCLWFFIMPHTSSFKRRQFVAMTWGASLLSSLALSASPLLAQAQSSASGYPAKPIRLVVPFPAGGATDIFARTLSQKLGEKIGATVVVENKPGAGGTLGSDLVAKSSADGYTLLLGTTGPLANNPLLYSKLPYDSLKDFAPVSNVANRAFVLVVHPTLPVNSVAQLIALAKSRPEPLAYASWGRGSATHLATELLMLMGNIKLVQVPYKGSGNAMPDMLSGQVQLAFDSLLSATPQLQAGRLRPLGVSALKRVALLPAVPTLAEQGFEGFEAGSWYGFLAPAKTPREIVVRLHAEIMKAINLPEVRERLASLGAEPIGNSAEEFSAQLRSDLERWGKVVKAAGIQPE